MKKILIVSTSYPNSRNTVAGIFIQNIAKALANLEEACEVEVLAPSVVSNRPIDQPVPVHFFRYAPNRLERIAQVPGGIPAALRANPFLLLIAPLFVTCMFFSILMRSRHTEVILAHWSLSGFVAGLAKKGNRLVMVFHGEDIRRAQGRGLGAWIASWSIKLSDHVVCVSRESLITLKERFPSQSGKMTFISNGVDDQLFEIERIKKKQPKVKGLVVNSLTAHKSTTHMLDALEMLDEVLRQKVMITVVGDGPERALLEQQAKQKRLEESVHFLGTLDQQDVFQLYKNSDFFLICSRGEGRSNVVMEAMASGLPIIASNVEGIRELLKDAQGGYLYNYGDCGQLANLLSQTIEDDNFRFDAGLKNREWSCQNGIDWKQSAERYLSLTES